MNAQTSDGDADNPNTVQQFLCIIFSNNLASDDLEIIEEASVETPRQVRLMNAKIGQPDPNAPNSYPVFSQNGAKFGFVAEITQMDAPFTDKYRIEGKT